MESEDERKLTRLVRELVGGKPVSEVNPKIIPQVIDAMEQHKQTAIANGQVERVRKLQSIMAELSKLDRKRKSIGKHKAKSEKSTSRSIDTTTEDSHKEITPAVVESVLADIMDGFPLDVAENYLLPSLIQAARDHVNQELSTGNYKEAQRYEDVGNTLVALSNERMVEMKKNEKREALVYQFTQAEEALRKENESLRQALEDHDERSKAAEDALNAEEEVTLNDHDAVTNGDLPVEKLKFSSALLNLRETEKFLVLSRRFEEAAGIKAEADQKEIEEVKAIHEKYLKQRKIQRNKLVESFDQRRKCLIEKNARLRQRIEQDHQAERSALERAVENWRQRIIEFDKNLEAQNIPIVETKKTPRAFVTQRTPPLSAHRTPRPATQTRAIRPGTSRLAKLAVSRK
ncbi:hypothetical protein TVAG_312080 [Trichomonas vaginalis G3]|uniref:Uncharacterized protein n=1 Tax=Trichomonas vaginalis (strain ATCC PRA-98 / G3) TaxID=412133 RepID=A2EHL3_TRIV3|nr:hypothetical protein TVAGG3_0242270 [Trichomonas vaginalis G3]EAY07809.1 hypothetical protein TVAG_312080 [Trichomonas vaginalis G3]KAI5553419.1 hypothetical protein TVAGG3_0242270 [Trichomonas vaginalis G3]|eukprot:XP_001320032.1 hypothetical protein [Trichomonas vaginalis G3]